MKQALRGILFLMLLGGCSAHLLAQKFTFSGYVRDAATGDDLIGATIAIPALSNGAFSNDYGFFSITVPGGEYQVVVSYLSYISDTLTLNLYEDRSLNIELQPESVALDLVEITDEVEDGNVTDLEMSTETMDLKQIRKLPAFMGEVDVIRSIQLLPGVQGVGEGITGYYVRGGQSNQNLILLDETTVYNASHLLGFFSVFNADALRDEYKLYKGGIPAQYGTRLSSVLDLKMREGNTKGFHATGGIGAISSRLTVEGPIVKDKASFIASGRRTYADAFLLFSRNEDLRDTRLYFYDFNVKANWRINDKNRIFASGYFGRDVFQFRNLFGNDWGNSTASVRWNHLFSDKLFSNTTAVYSDFDYGFDASAFTGESFSYTSGIQDFGLKEDITWFATPDIQLKFGGELVLHEFNPGIFTPEANTFLEASATEEEYALEGAAYLSMEHSLSKRFSMLYGLRYSLFEQIGPGEEYTYNDSFEEILDTTNFNTGEIIQHYGGFEPRFALRYLLDEKSSLKASYMRTRQYLHLVGNSTASFPWDIWVPSSRHIRPQIADQVAVGYFRNFLDNALEASVEVYYKDLQNQLDFKNGAELFLNPTLEREILTGVGESYGAEFLLRKPRGRLSGWVGYTLSRTTRTIDGINDGNPYSANSDRRHDVSLVSTYAISPRVDLGLTWVYATGAPVSLPVGAYVLDSNLVPLYGARNSDRMPDYHRMDLSLTINGKDRSEKKRMKNMDNSWNISLYNVYGRRNAFSYDFREEIDTRPVEGQPGVTEEVRVRRAYKIYLFRWVPSVTWNFKF